MAATRRGAVGDAGRCGRTSAGSNGRKPVVGVAGSHNPRNSPRGGYPIPSLP